MILVLLLSLIDMDDIYQILWVDAQEIYLADFDIPKDMMFQ